MIAGDDVARSAFRVSLREQPSSPALITQELDPADILEVHDVAEAIARAEKILRTPLPVPATEVAAKPAADEDLFEALARPTDDTAGPAVAASARISSVPPPPEAEAKEATTEVATEAAPVTLRSPAPVLHVPTSLPGPEDDAYFHPGGRIRTFGEVTVDGYRPEATLLVRLRQRRTRFTFWIAAALVLLTAFTVAAIATPGAEPHVAARSTLRASRAADANGASFTSAGAKAAPGERSDVPVLDVSRLPSAR